MPSGVDPEKISSKLSKEGVLTVTAPREAVSISAFKKTEALENKNNGLSKANSSEGLKEPKMVCEKDKIEISVDAKEYRWVLHIVNEAFNILSSVSVQRTWMSK